MHVDGAPSYLTRFVGRDDLRGAVARAIGSSRLVTLLGPGGIGKTRLAVEAARADGGSGRAVFVDLAALARDDEAAVRAAVLSAAAPPASAPASLLVVDNCEHVTAAARSVVAEVLHELPSLRVLATSREPLGVPGEVCTTVPPLDATSDASALFLDRAALVVTGYQPDEPERRRIAELCRRVDGLPLAIELAAARSRLLTPTEMLERLDERFRLLAGSTEETVARHRRLDAAIDWSHDLLDPEEQALVRRLAVFPGPFDVAVVEAVAVADPRLVDDPVEVLERLVAKSLVQSGRRGERTVFWLLDSIRERARHWLERAGEGTAVRQHHLAWLSRAVDHADEQRAVVSYREFVAALTDLAADVEVAMPTAVAAPDPDVALALVGVLWHLWMNRGLVEPGRRWADAALRRDGGDPSLRARAANAAANLDVLAGDADAARGRYLEALRLRRESGDRRGEATTLNDLGVLSVRSGDSREAAAWLADAAAAAAEVGDAHASATAHGNLGAVHLADGALDAASAALTAAAAAYAVIGDDYGLAACHGNLATVHLDNGDPTAASASLGEAVAAVARLDDHSLVPALVGIAAALAHDFGHDADAAAHLGTLDNLRRRSGIRPEAAEEVREDRLRAAVAGALGPTAFTVAWRAGAERDEAAALRAVVGDVAGPAVEPVPVPPAVANAAATGTARFRRAGEQWHLDFRGVHAVVPDSRGVRYLARLLASGGSEVGALELMGGDVGELAVDADLGGILDDAARDSFRERLQAAARERERAERRGDTARLAALDEEVDAIGAALRAATDRRGRARRTGGDAERARKAVTNRIRHAIGVIEGVHPALGAHLRNAVRTGTFCEYRPEQPVPWDVEPADSSGGPAA